MSKLSVIAKAREFAKEKSAADRTGHDWWHVERVARLALTIAKSDW